MAYIHLAFEYLLLEDKVILWVFAYYTLTITFFELHTIFHLLQPNAKAELNRASCR